MQMITSMQNEKVKFWYQLKQKKYRDKNNRFLVEGDHLIQEAQRAGCLEYILTDQEEQGDNVFLVTSAILKHLSETVSPVHRLGVCRKLNLTMKKKDRILLLDRVQDPGNLGTIIRTAKSFCYDGIFCSPGCADIYNEKTIRSTQGALFTIPVIYRDLTDSIQVLQEQGIPVIATALYHAQDMTALPAQKQMAFVFGNEGQGISADLQKKADICIRVPMQGFESLNVAVAAGIVMYTYQPR